jgi:hypothetical protein
VKFHLLCTNWHLVSGLEANRDWCTYTDQEMQEPYSLFGSVGVCVWGGGGDVG